MVAWFSPFTKLAIILGIYERYTIIALYQNTENFVIYAQFL